MPFSGSPEYSYFWPWAFDVLSWSITILNHIINLFSTATMILLQKLGKSKVSGGRSEYSPRPTFCHSNHDFSIRAKIFSVIFFVALTTQIDGQFDTPFSIVRCVMFRWWPFHLPHLSEISWNCSKYHFRGLNWNITYLSCILLSVKAWAYHEKCFKLLVGFWSKIFLWNLSPHRCP